MQVLTILVGLPASGKSTYAQQHNNSNTVVLSSDEIRKELLHNEQDQSNNSFIFGQLYSRARAQLDIGNNVIIDATNINVFERARVLQNFRNYNVHKVAIFFDTPIEECIERDKKRERTVGADVIEYYYNKFQKPTKTEGFDEIIIIK